VALAVAGLARGVCSGQPAGITAKPNPASPGQTVTLTWHFVGDKVMLYGGRFGLGVNVTTRKSITDKPRKSTRYAVIVWHRPAGPGTSRVQSRYEVAVETMAPEPLAVHRGAQGWQVKYPKAWRADSSRLPDPANNGLVFFQKEPDSVERLAVSVLPAQDGGSEGLIKKVRASAQTSYRHMRVVTESATTHAGVPAAWMVFSGQPETHPGVGTQSMVLAFVKGARAYVVSARTRATRYGARATALERMIRSFTPSRK